VIILLGYLLGSISPAYFLGKWLKKIDIREHGTKNAGTENVKKTLGLGPAIITGAFDLSKGLLAMLIASFFISDLFIVFLAGLMAIVGHIFPFYLKFKGGQGQATAVGLLFYFLIRILINGWFPWTALLIIAIAVILMRHAAKSALVAGLITLPFFIAYVLLSIPLNLITVFFSIILVFIFLQALNVGIKEKRLPNISKKKELLRWRTLMRPLAVIILLLYVLLGKSIVLIIIGVVALIFILTDLSRLSFKKFNLFLLKGLFIKEKEKKVFSSMSFFMLACFIILLVFERDIAFLSVLFLIFGDLAAKFIGILYGRTKMFKKTLEGFLGYFVLCILTGFLASYFLNISLLMIIIGSLVAAFVEVIPIGIDDNFTVGLISGSVMYLIK